MNVLMTKRKVGLLLLGIVQLIVLSMIAAMQLNLSYYTISVLAIVQCVVNIILLKIVCNLPVLCIPNMFSVFSLFFHCGQIIKEGFNVQGTVPLPFQYYADEGVIQKACLFYLMSQATYFIGLADILSGTYIMFQLFCITITPLVVTMSSFFSIKIFYRITE